MSIGVGVCFDELCMQRYDDGGRCVCASMAVVGQRQSRVLPHVRTLAGGLVE